MQPVETYEVGKYTVEINSDPDPMNPRTDFDQCSYMICFHKRYDLGDKHNYKFENYDSWDDLEKSLIEEHSPIVIKPLYLYDHGCISIATSRFSCSWDSGQVGFIIMTAEQAKELFEVSEIDEKVIKRCDNYIEASVKEYDQYLTGDIYGYVIKETETDEEVTSCWGFYGIDSVKEEANDVANNKFNQVLLKNLLNCY